ncbi:MAG: CehA/McbA family metallohydrolase [Anaerolineae bacterium]|nr:CehA/McbA family metallohydrolase [Anaerolineae bacterium]
MEELVTNLHMHTTYSDGSGSHADIAAAALKAGLDVVIVTDHNVLVNGKNRYYQEGDRECLLLIAEEIHDRTVLPQKNHLLVLGVERELSAFAADTQNLIDLVSKNNGICFIAHPFEVDLPIVGDPDITWEKWQCTGYTGMEIWNGLSELKSRMTNPFRMLLYLLFPELMPKGADLKALDRWDLLTRQGKKVVAIGSSDAHQVKFKKWPIHFSVFPYEFHFRCVNTHLLVSEPLNGDINHDRRLVFEAFRDGHAFVGYDLPASTRGFRFSAQGKDQNVIMGDEIALDGGVTLQIRLPFPAACQLIKDGEIFRSFEGRSMYTQIINQPGVYRVESYTHFMGETRGWIYSNPIYVR